MKLEKIYPTGEYPTQWDDLINEKRETIATIYTLEEAKEDGFEEGITLSEDGVYDIVVDVQEITNKVVESALEQLGKITKKKYVFICKTLLQ